MLAKSSTTTDSDPSAAPLSAFDALSSILGKFQIVQSSTNTDSNDSPAPLSAFDRAKARLGIRNKGSAASKPSATLDSAPSSILEKFHSSKGGEKTAFFRSHKAELMAAEAAAPVLPAALRPAAPLPTSPPARHREPSATDTPEALLEKFQGMTGAGKTAFFRANKSFLKAAAAVVSARESTGEAPAVRNYSVAQAAAPHQPSGSDLLATFHTLSGTAKTAFFRANHLALKIAAANEAR